MMTRKFPSITLLVGLASSPDPEYSILTYPTTKTPRHTKKMATQWNNLSLSESQREGNSWR